MRRYGASQRQTCGVLKISRSSYGYKSIARDCAPLVSRIKEIAAVRVRYGYRRVHVLLRREGWRDNHKRVYRLYRSEGLPLRHRRPKRNKAARLRQPKHLVHSINEIWSMDFVSDALFDGRRLRALTVVDTYTRECLAIEVGQSLKGEDVVNVLDRIKADRDLPSTIKVDNGSEFISKVMDRWTHENGVELDLSRPGRPIDNAKIESFSGCLCTECLNPHGFLSLVNAKSNLEIRCRYYNEVHPHTVLQWIAPVELPRRWGLEPASTDQTEPEISISERYYNRCSLDRGLYEQRPGIAEEAGQDVRSLCGKVVA